MLRWEWSCEPEPIKGDYGHYNVLVTYGPQLTIRQRVAAKGPEDFRRSLERILEFVEYANA